MRLARTIRFDDSDEPVFETPAQPADWALSGAFEFSDPPKELLTVHPAPAPRTRSPGTRSSRRATFIATAKIEEAEYAALIDRLAAHFVDVYGAPDLAAARPVAEDELRFMREMCEDQDPNTILFVTREMVEDGVSESFQAIKPKEATLDIGASHGERDDI